MWNPQCWCISHRSACGGLGSKLACFWTYRVARVMIACGGSGVARVEVRVFFVEVGRRGEGGAGGGGGVTFQKWTTRDTMKELISCLPECFWFLMGSTESSSHGGKITLARRLFLAPRCWVSAGKPTRYTVGGAASLRSKGRYGIIHISSKVHQSFQTQSTDSWGS